MKDFFSTRSLPAAVLLTVCMVVSAVALALPRSVFQKEAADQGPAEWLALAESLRKESDLEGAIEAIAVGRAITPWHPDLCRKQTELLLEKGDKAVLVDWMDAVVLEDARLAEVLFMLPGFQEWSEDPRLSALKSEAYQQARD